MSEDQPDPSPEETAPRLTFFRILCIASLLGSGMGLVSYLFCGIFYDSLGPAIDATPFKMQREVMEVLLSAGRWFFITNAIFYGLSLFGAVQMWNLRKIGFHFYAIAQILLLIVPMLFIHGNSETLPQAMVSGIFIFAYASNLRYMH
jgi:hypothetical protein